MKSKKGDCPVEIHSLEKVWISKEQSPSYIFLYIGGKNRY